jgi:hypothetical protein
MNSAPVYQHLSKGRSSDQTAGIGEFIAAMDFIRSLYGIDNFRER